MSFYNYNWLFTIIFDSSKYDCTIMFTTHELMTFSHDILNWQRKATNKKRDKENYNHIQK